jgi:hypothetical protein
MMSSTAPVGVSGVREINKRAFVYDLHGRKVCNKKIKK